MTASRKGVEVICHASFKPRFAEASRERVQWSQRGRLVNRQPVEEYGEGL